MPSVQDVIEMRQAKKAHSHTIQTQFQQPQGGNSSGQPANFNAKGDSDYNYQGNSGNGSGNDGQAPPNPYGSYSNNGQQFQTIASKPDPRKKPGFIARWFKGDPAANGPQQPPVPPDFRYPTQPQQQQNWQQQQSWQQQHQQPQQSNNQTQAQRTAQNTNQQFNQGQNQPSQNQYNQNQYNGPSANQFSGVSPPPASSTQGTSAQPQRGPNGPYYKPTNEWPKERLAPVNPKPAPPADFSQRQQQQQQEQYRLQGQNPQPQFQMPISAPQGQLPAREVPHDPQFGVPVVPFNNTPQFNNSPQFDADGAGPGRNSSSNMLPQLPNAGAAEMDEEDSLLDNFFPGGSEERADNTRSPYQSPPPGLSTNDSFTLPMPETRNPARQVDTGLNKQPMLPGFDSEAVPEPPTLPKKHKGKLDVAVKQPLAAELPLEEKVETPKRPTAPVTPPQTVTPPISLPAVTETPVAAPSAKDRAAANREKLQERHGRKGLMGFCPVSLRDERDLVEARSEFVSEYNGKTYYFASAHARAVFDENPAKYAPAAGGGDTVVLAETGEDKEGALEWASWYKGRLYLFSEEKRMNEFLATPSHFAVEN